MNRSKGHSPRDRLKKLNKFPSKDYSRVLKTIMNSICNSFDLQFENVTFITIYNSIIFNNSLLVNKIKLYHVTEHSTFMEVLDS